MLYLVIAVLVVITGAWLVPMLRPDNRLREVDRFWTARQLTSSWAGLSEPQQED